jgi:Ala-tRNA(Pro) deacylase
MSIAQRLREFLNARRATYRVVDHAPTFTAQETAQTLHTPGREIAKVVVVRHGGKLALAVLPAQARVDLLRFSSVLRAPVSLASEAEFTAAFPDCEAGAMPPFGNLYGLQTYVDESLTHDREIAFNAGTHTEAIRMAFDEYRRLAEPVVVWFAEEPASAGS